MGMICDCGLRLCLDSYFRLKKLDKKVFANVLIACLRMSGPDVALQNIVLLRKACVKRCPDVNLALENDSVSTCAHAVLYCKIILLVQIWAYYLFELVGLRLCLERECTNESKCFIGNENELLTYNISMFYKILQYNPGGLPLDDSP